MKILAIDIQKLLAMMVLAIGMALPASAQKTFNGTFSYAIRLTGKESQAILENDPPKKMDLHIRDGNYIISITGGRIPRTIVFISDSNETYIIDAANRRAFRETYFLDTMTVAPTAVPTGETKEIKGIVCQEYLVEKPELQQRIYYYVNDEYRVDMKAYEGKTEAKTDFMTLGLDGRIPIRKVIKSPGLYTELDMISTKVKLHDMENFQVPPGFKLKKRDPRK